MYKEIIIYIHGFGSSGFGGKATDFKNLFGKKVITPSLSYVPILAIDTLEQMIATYKELGVKVNLIGSSLGGYYSIYLAYKYDLKAVLINPAMKPYELLNKIGFATNYFDQSKFEVIEKHLEFLKTLEIIEKDNNKYMLLLCEDDETLDYTQALKQLPNSKTIIQKTGGHQFFGVTNYLEEINVFLD